MRITWAGDPWLVNERAVSELEVAVRAVARGKEIAQRLGLSAKTVEAHRAQLMERLDVHDLAGLVRFAVRVGLVRTED